MTGHSICEIDFEHWVTLASTDPQKFEQLRQDKISAVIDRTSGHSQQRLRGLQWRIDKVREQHKDSASAACVAISELMWEAFEQLAELLRSQAENSMPSTSLHSPRTQAIIIPFPTHSKS